MKQVIYLTEQDLNRMVKRTIAEMYQNGEIDEGKLKNIAYGTMLGAASLGLMHGAHKLHNHKIANQQQSEIETQTNDSIPEYTFDPYQYYPSDNIINKIKEFEGWHGGFDSKGKPLPGWQDDGKGNLTTGWGFKITNQLKRKYPHGMTREQADHYLIHVAIPERVKQFMGVMETMPALIYYTQDQMDALFDLFYNIGITSFKERSPKLMKALRYLDSKSIIQNMDHDYNNKKVPGAKKRRDYERSFFK